MKPEFIEFLTTSTRGVGVVDGIEIQHSHLGQSLYLTSCYPGFDAVDETGQSKFYEYVPMTVVRASKQSNLSQEFKFTIQDINEIVAYWLDKILLDSTERPRVVLRSFIYREDGSISDIQDGPYDLGAGDITFTEKGCTFTATPGMTNYSGTGEIYTFHRFPTLVAYAQ